MTTTTEEPTVTRASHCACGRPALYVLPGGPFGPTGYCGIPGNPPVEPCDCGEGAERHSRNVCHIYGRESTVRPAAPLVLDVDGREVPIPTRCPAWCDQEPFITALENAGQLTADEIARHVSTGTELHTSDPRNPISGRVGRRGGAAVLLRLRQDALNPLSAGAGFASHPLVEAEVTDSTDRHRLHLLLTTCAPSPRCSSRWPIARRSTAADPVSRPGCAGSRFG